MGGEGGVALTCDDVFCFEVGGCADGDGDGGGGCPELRGGGDSGVEVPGGEVGGFIGEVFEGCECGEGGGVSDFVGGEEFLADGGDGVVVM